MSTIKSVTEVYPVEVRVLVKEVRVSDLQPGDSVWYWLRRDREKKKLTLPHAHGPFVVVGTDPFTLKNPGGVDFKLDPEKLTLLVVATDPPVFL